MFGHSKKRSFRGGPAAPLEKPLRDELLSVEGLEETAKALAARFTIDPNPRRRSRSVFRRFDDNARVLRDTYRSLADEVHEGEFVTPAVEWLLDNFHLVVSEVRDIRHNLPRGYYRQLPELALRELAGHARVYAMAVSLIRHGDSRLDRQRLLRFVNSYQTVAPLTIGELWAWPSMLKLALIENLRRLADEMMEARDARPMPMSRGSRPQGRPDTPDKENHPPCRRCFTLPSFCNFFNACVSTVPACRPAAPAGAGTRAPRAGCIAPVWKAFLESHAAARLSPSTPASPRPGLNTGSRGDSAGRDTRSPSRIRNGEAEGSRRQRSTANRSIPKRFLSPTMRARTTSSSRWDVGDGAAGAARKAPRRARVHLPESRARSSSGSLSR